MEEETEVLDWGNEDDEQQYEQRAHNHHTGANDGEGVEDAEEDAVSLGGDEDDDVEHYYAYQSSSNKDGTSMIVTSKAQQPLSSSVTQGNSNSTRELQRDQPSNSRKPTSHSQSQQSPQRTSPRRSQSFGKMTHSLPPKPVLSSVPFMQPTHPSSLIEATAMSGSTHSKHKGVNGKPVSTPDDTTPLPPDWEMKQPRSGSGGVYYYNVRTHQSTWTRPILNSGGRSPVKEKERTWTLNSESRGSIRSSNSSPTRHNEQQPLSGRSVELSPQVTSDTGSLSYGDRHYRPGEGVQVPTTNVLEKRHDDDSATSPRMSSDLPLQAPSPAVRGRDDKRPSRSHHRNSSPPVIGSDPLRENPRLPPHRVRSPDRHWIAPQEHLPRKSSGRRQPSSSHDHHRERQEDVEMSPATPANLNEDRNDFRNEADWSSTHRPRSPLPHMMRESRPAPKGSSASLPPPAAAAPRTKTRFDQPATRSPKNSRGPLLPRTQDDVYIPDDLIPIRRERDSELTSVQIGVEQHEATRRRQNTDEHAPNRRSGLPPLSLPDFDQSSAYLQERSVSGSGDSHSPANAAESQSRLKRTPLPPQSLRFREMAKRPSDKADVSPSFPKLPPIVTRDGGMNQSRSTDVRNSLPAGPRHLLPVAPSREIIPRESRSSRLPPSGPSADSNGNRRRNENSFSSNQAPLPRDQNAMDLDVVQPFRPQPPTLKINELPIRAHSGMYADRVESNNTDTAPKQPRAMTNRMPSAHQPAAVPPTSPTSHFPQRSTAVPDYQGGRTRGRSPPPNMTRNHNEHPQDDRPSRFSQPDSQMLRRRMPPRRASNAEDRSPVEFRDPAASQGPVSRDQPRRGVHNSRGHFSQGPPRAPPGFSGSNSIPIGNRKNQSAGPPTSQIISPAENGRWPQPPSGNMELQRDRLGHNAPPNQDSFETLVTSPGNRYRLPERNVGPRNSMPLSGRMTPPHPHQPVSPSDSFQTRAVPGRSRTDDDWFVQDARRTDVYPARAQQEDLEPRIWTQRPASQHRPNYGDSDDLRTATPPPPSREPSWDTGERHNPANHRQQERRHSRFDRPARQDESNAPTLHQLPDVDGRRRVHAPPHPVSARRASFSGHGSHPEEQQYVDSYRPRGPPSPAESRRYESFVDRGVSADDGRHQSFPDIRGPHPSLPDRPPQSWDREQDENTSPSVTRGLQSEHPPPRTSKPVRIRRPSSQALLPNQPDDFSMQSEGPSEHWRSDNGPGEERREDMEMGSQAPNHQQRPTPSRRGGSLLDRLSLDDNGPPLPAIVPQPSLRDRVQVPSKRDRDELAGGELAGDGDMDDGTGGDPASKKLKRRMKSKRGRRSNN